MILGVLLAGCTAVADGPISTPSDVVSDLTDDSGGDGESQVASIDDDDAQSSQRSSTSSSRPRRRSNFRNRFEDDDSFDLNVSTSQRKEVPFDQLPPDRQIKRALVGKLFEFQSGSNKKKLGFITYSSDGTLQWSDLSKENRKNAKWWVEDGKYCDDTGEKKFFDGRRNQCVDFRVDADDFFLAKTRLRPLGR